MAKSKKPAKKASSGSLSETSKPSLKATLTEELLEVIRLRPKAQRREIGAAINSVVESWGHPHIHAGIGIRRLTKTIFECRVGLDDRLAFIFIATPAELVFFFIGNQDEIRKLIRSRG